MFSYLYDFSETDLEELSLKFLSFLEPKGATLESVGHIVSLYGKTLKKMLSIFEFNPLAVKENQLVTYPKNTPKSTNVIIQPNISLMK